MEFDEDEKEHPLVLAKNVKELLLEFWDSHANGWMEEWNQTNSLPKMVKVTLRLTSPNQSYASSQAQEEIIRIVALPSITVPASWQVPNLSGPEVRHASRQAELLRDENYCAQRITRHSPHRRDDFGDGFGYSGGGLRVFDEGGNEAGAKCEFRDGVDLAGAFGSGVRAVRACAAIGDWE